MLVCRTALGAAIAATLAAVAAPAAYGADRILDQINTETGSVVVQFACPMSFVSNYPLRTGDEIRIELQPLPGCAPSSSLGETLPVSQGNPAGLVDLRLEQSLGSRRSLTLHFARTVDFLIKPRPGLTGIEVVLSRRVGRADVTDANPPPKPSRAPTRSLPSPEELEQVLAQARAAMQDRDYDSAIRLYSKLLEYPEHPSRAQAQEYVGLARERKGQLAQAKIEYEEYLRRYPEGTDADAVKQRLAAIVTLTGATKPTRGSPDSRWQVNGALAQNYRHDTNTVSSEGVTSNGIGQSAVDTEADLQMRHRGNRFDVKARIFAGYVKDLSNVQGVSGSSPVRVPQAYLEFDDNVRHWISRFGRQSQSTGGVYGSYDGAFLGLQFTPGFRLGLAAGSPIQTYSSDTGHQRVFGNIAFEFPGVAPGLDVTGFVGQENAHGVLDSRQVGVETRYYRDGKSLVGQLDYDVSFKVLNSATALASWGLPGHFTVTGVFDHRRAPFVSTYNALIGQATDSISDLISSLGLPAVRQLALDRSATADTVTVGLQRPIGERLQWSSDVAMSKVSGTRASGGVPATPASGSAVGFSTQLMGGGWIVDGDMNTVGVGYSTRSSTKSISAYASARYPVGQAIRIGPRLQINHTSGSDPALGLSSGWSAGPSLLADWRFRHGNAQLETGYERSALNSSLAAGVPIDPTTTPNGTVNQQTRRFWFSLGYSISF